MKNSALILTAALLAVLVIQGCDKVPLSGPDSSPEIKTSKTTVYPFDGGDTLLYTGAGAADSLKWTVSPEGNSYIRQKGNVAVIIFGKVGTYVVTANKINGGTPASITMNVISSVIPFKSDGRTTLTNLATSTSDTVQYVPITGDVKLGLIYYRNPAGDSVLVNFNAATVNSFCSRGTMQFSSVLGNDRNYSLDLINIRQPLGCAGATAPDRQAGEDRVFVNKLLGLGSHSLKITYSGVTYNGSIDVAAHTITINWPYTTGVLITPKVVNQ
ncbi:hypothetical protein [Mucilaginibacter sp. UYCu711]|uniref:hypothetical protein n=1 Tax=Mucilaginibacter sp. UYCu711 TaxID=3156339 RepID=UPI003D233A20